MMTGNTTTTRSKVTSPIAGTSEMARLIRARDWTSSGLGGLESWPQSLVTTVNLMLQSPVPLVMLWGPDGIMLYNDAYSVFAGKRHPQLLGSKVVEGWPEVADFNAHVLAEVRGKGKTLEYKDQQLTLYRNNAPEEVSMNLSYSPVIDESGKPNGVIAVVIETTEQLAARREIEEIASINKSITDNATTGLLIMDASHYITHMNPAAERITGYSLRDIQKEEKTLHDILHPTRPDGSPYPLEDCPTSVALASRKRVLAEDVFFRPDGSMYPVSIMSSPIVHGKELVGIVEEIRDITEEKAAANEIQQLNRELEGRVDERTRELTAANKELNRSNEELQDFAYVASHDLQEPLRKIAAFAGLLEADYGDLLPDEAHRYLKSLQRSSERMRMLITDLLTYSRVTTKARPFEKVSLHKMALEALEDMQSRIDETKADILIGKLPVIEADPLQIRLLLQNLISNAMKYSRAGAPPKITVSSKDADGWCELTVADNGIGFDERYLDRIFTIFQRLHGRGEYEGTGVGLAICKKIVDRHGGTITAQSKPGEGAAFIVRLPLRQEAIYG